MVEPVSNSYKLQIQKSPTEVRLLILYFGSAEVTRAALIYHDYMVDRSTSQDIY